MYQLIYNLYLRFCKVNYIKITARSLSEKALIACSFYLKLIFGNLTSIQPSNEDNILNVSLSFKVKIKT